MERYFRCACCGEDNCILIDVDNGDYQELKYECDFCGKVLQIEATFNYHTGRYDIKVYHEAVG